MISRIANLAYAKNFKYDIWLPFTNWGVKPGMSPKQVFHARVVNQLSLLAVTLGLTRLLVFAILGGWRTFALGAIVTSFWIFPPWLNRMGYPQSAKVAFLGVYLFIFVFFTMITAESYGHWGVFFVAVGAVLFYTDKLTIWVFGILALLTYITCELWIQTMPPIFPTEYPLFGSISRGVGVGLTFFLLFSWLSTELQASETKAHSDKERLDAIIAGALDAVITVNTQNVITGWNPQAEHIFGYTRKEAEGKLLQELIIPEAYWNDNPDGVKHNLETGVGPLLNQRTEIEGKRKNGVVFPVELTIIPVEQGGERFFSFFIRDITEVKQAQEKLLALNEELKQFASVASHDLREPLRNISAFSALLLEDTPQNEQAKEYIDFIQEATDRMSRLLTDLIAFARAEADTGTPHGIDLNQTLAAACSNLTVRIKETNAKIISEHLPVVMGHSSAYLQLFQNMLANSLKYQPEGNLPEVHLSAERVGEFWQITFRDNGIGIPPEKAEEIFKPFHRLHSDIEVEGSGIGLATCRKIAERYGGRIWTEPNGQQGGAVFYLQLPAANE